MYCIEKFIWFKKATLDMYYFPLQNTGDFSLVHSSTGDVVTEDGRSHCPYNPEYKSTAIMAGMYSLILEVF